MRLFELKNQYPSTPLVYVDMDGVLADFFGAVARVHSVDDWRSIKRRDEAEIRAAKLPGFFEKLPALPNAYDLIKGVVHRAGSYSILSSPLQSDVEKSVAEKSNWIRQHLANYPPTEELFSHHKYRYAKQADGTPNILIDDYPANIELWEAHGGIGILYRDKDVEQVLDKLKRALAGESLEESTDPRVRYGASYVIPENRSDAGDVPEGEIDTEVGNLADNRLNKKLYTGNAVLKYVKGQHHEYSLDDPITDTKVWMLVNYPVERLKTPENSMFDDPYKRIIDLDMDHIRSVSKQDIDRRPIVVDANGWILDGNHRATKAMMLGINNIPAFVPYQ